jgi:predicted nucleic acid-binding protein
VSLYLDSSSFLKLYLDEPDAERAEAILGADSDWVSGRHTAVEVRRNLTRLLEGAALTAARSQFARDWESTAVVELTAEVCEFAAELAEVTGARTLDALHLGAAKAVGGGALPLVTFDVRQAQAARSLGWVVLGA